jgi:hypothetical protein
MPSRFDVGATIAYATPVGSAERGAHVRDTTIGIVPLRLDVGYAFTRWIGLVATGAYAPAIPTLCQTAGDCVASLGSDVTLSLRTRVRFPSLGPTTPRLELGLGYEWFTTRLVDSGATSTRAYEGPIFALVEASAPLRLGSRWTFAPLIGALLGVFTSESLETNVGRQEGNVRDRAVHLWLTLGVRAGIDL